MDLGKDEFTDVCHSSPFLNVSNKRMDAVILPGGSWMRR
jgi:hypothetical protein